MKNGPKVKIGTDAAKLGDASTKFENIRYFEALIFLQWSRWYQS